MIRKRVHHLPRTVTAVLLGLCVGAPAASGWAQEAPGSGTPAAVPPEPPPAEVQPAPADGAPATPDAPSAPAGGAPAATDAQPVSADGAPATSDAQPAPADAGDAAGRRRGLGRGGSTDVNSAQWLDEYHALTELISRYGQEVEEFEKDVQETIDRKYVDELKKHQERYDEELRKLLDDVTVRRKEAIARYEQFLQRYPNSEHSAIAMVRLAELYYEEAQIDFLFADKEYERQWEEYREGKRSNPPAEEEPRQDFTRSLALYDRVLTQFPEYKDVDGVYYMKGFILGKEDSVNYDADASKDAFLQLIAVRPQSDYAFQSFLLIGDYYFDKNQLEESISYYLKAMEYKDKSWDRALYKLAWAQYRLGEWDQAIARFFELLDYSEALKAREDKESDLRPEAVQYLAISFADSGTFDDAVAHFKEIGGRPYELEVLERLAEVYVQLARYDDGIDAYRKLQTLFPDNPDNPAFQAEIVKIYLSNPGGPDVDAALAAKMELVDRYNAEASWSTAMNESLNKMAMSHAQDLVRDSLRDIAYHYHSLAGSPDTPEAAKLGYYDKASEYYRQYLSRYPYSDDAYELQYYYADCLYYSGHIEEAAREFSRALTYAEPKHHVEAAHGMVDAYALLISQKGLRDGVLQPYPDQGPDTKNPQPLPIDPLLQEYVKAIDTYSQFDKDTAVAPKLLLIAARIFYFHNEYDEARRRFDDLIALYPADESSLQAAQYIVDTYNRQGDYAQVIASVDRLMAMNLGGGGPAWQQVRATLLEFKSTATFRDAVDTLALQETDITVAAEKNTEAAERFLKYADEFPNTEYTASALANAAIGFDLAGDTERAIEVNKRIIREHPESEFAEAAYYSIASNYEKSFDFPQAIKYHEELARTFEKSPNAPISLFNASYLRLGLKQYNEAAAGFERYVRLYSDRDDAEAVLFLAAETYEKAGNWREAIRVYSDYIRRYPRSNGDRVMLSYQHIIKGLDTLNRTRETLDYEKRMTTDFTALRDGSLMTLRGLNVYASVQFREIQRQFNSFRDVKLGGSERQLAKQFETKQNALATLGTAVAEIAKLGDAEHRLAGLYTLGLAYKTFAAQALELPCPAGLDEYECELYTEQLREMFVYPMEEDAIAVFERVLADAKENGQINQWVDNSWDRLSEMQPDFYPIRKPERLEMVGADKDFPLPPVQPAPADNSSARR